MIKAIFKLGPIQMGLFLIVMPLSIGILEVAIHLISIIGNFNFNIPLFEIAVFIVHIIFLLWVWSVSVIINEKTLKINTEVFKIAFIFYASYRFFNFLMNTNPGLLETGWFLENEIIYFIESITFVYGIIVLASYIYLAFFTNQIITKMVHNKTETAIDAVPGFFFMIIFPIGIPLLQSKVEGYLNENKVFDFNQATNNTVPKTQEIIEEKTEDIIIEDIEIIDREDPTRFMRK